jgi:DNA-binding response OmpR family regulator
MAKILVIDDDPNILRVIKVRLRSARHEVVTASDGQEGIRRMKEDAPDLLITDVMMPEVDGFAVVEAVRGDEGLRRTPIIMLTARDDVNEVIEGLERGADDYVVKPFNIQELLARVHALLRMRDLQLKALEAERLKALLEMAGTAAHEINSPLTVIVGHVELMMRKTKKKGPSYESLMAIRNNAARIAEIVEKFRMIRRYESKTYWGHIKILDLERSTREEREGDV